MQESLALLEHWKEYQDITQLALSGDRRSANERISKLLLIAKDDLLRAHLYNDLAVIASVDSRTADAVEGFRAASDLAPQWSIPRQNLDQLQRFCHINGCESTFRKTKVAILSLLFNWPSSGGGTVHTAETGKFLTKAGFDVCHMFAQFPEWGLGLVTEPLLSSSKILEFTADQWTVPQIKMRFEQALDEFEPDWVIITDSWNSKPILAEAARNYRFILRIAAQECLCPLNNVRLLFNDGRFSNCPKQQLATPADCCKCVAHNGRFSGGLHQAERELVSYGTQEYDAVLRWAFAKAEAVFVVNPLIAAMVSPYAKKVCVVPSGFDPTRFANLEAVPRSSAKPIVRILFAGLVDELMKGFQVALEACELLWKERHDFELVATADPIGQVNQFTHYVGWQTQADLPKLIFNADILIFPTVAEEALGRTAVEAMGASRPVVASRIGGLQFTVIDGATGLLFEPGDAGDLYLKLKRLLDDPELRQQFGRAGRMRFEEHYTWESILSKHYLPLLGEPVRNLAPNGSSLNDSSRL